MSATMNLTALRKTTKFQLCERHAPWFAGETRYRKIECLNEGGPGGWSPGCAGGKCRLWRGTDYHVPESCYAEADDLDWTTTT